MQLDPVEINIDEILSELDPLGLALFQVAQERVVNRKLREELARIITEDRSE